MRIAKVFVALAAATLTFAACTNQKVPAEKTVAKIESSLAEFRADAEKYGAEQLQAVDASVAKIKGNLAKQDYRAVIVAGPSVVSEVNSLKVAVATKKAEVEQTLAAAQAEWTELSASVPPLVEKVQARVDKLTKTRKLPKDVDKAAFDRAKAEFQSAKEQWTQAASDFAAGNAGNAVRLARSAKAKGEEVLRILGEA
jgi:chromosome segregation ATPase